MSTNYDFKAMHKIGYPRVLKLFNLSDLELKEYLGKLFPDLADSEKSILFGCNAEVTRFIKDGKVDNISISYYDTIKIDWVSITLKPEHGVSTQLLSLSNEHIILDIPEPKEGFKIG